MQDYLDALDFPLVVPAGASSRIVLVGASDRPPTSMAVRAELEPGLWAQMETFRRRGFLRGTGGRPSQHRLDAWSVAAAAVHGLVGGRIPNGLPRAELSRRAREAHDISVGVGADLFGADAYPPLWRDADCLVGDEVYALRVHERVEGAAAVTDLGACLLTVVARRLPAPLRLRWMSPQQAREELEVGSPPPDLW